MSWEWDITNVGADDYSDLIEAFFDCCGYADGAEKDDDDYGVISPSDLCRGGMWCSAGGEFDELDGSYRDMAVILDALFPGTDLRVWNIEGNSDGYDAHDVTVYSPSRRQIISESESWCMDFEGSGYFRGKDPGDHFYGDDGFDEDGYNEDGFDRDGLSYYSKKPRSEYDTTGFDRNRFYSEFSYLPYGYDSDNRDPLGYDREGLDDMGFDLGGHDHSSGIEAFQPAAPDPRLIRELIERSLQSGEDELHAMLLELLRNVEGKDAE